MTANSQTVYTKPGIGQTLTRFLTALVILGTFAAIASACGSDSGPAPAASNKDEVNDFGFEVSVIANAGRTYDVDDLVNAGWKRSRELPSEGLQGASEVWFGFYQQKNLEVRIYASHEDAKAMGVGPAEEVVARTRGVSVGAAGPYMKQTTQYAGYGVIGNLVVLCELEVKVCSNLATALDSQG